MKIMAATCGTLLLAACTPLGTTGEDPAALMSARAVGEPVDCIETANIQATRIQSSRVVDFRLRGERLYRNVLPNACGPLAAEGQFTYSGTNGRLCRTDTIKVLTGGSVPGPSCRIGSFQRIETN